jgi:hypothetical protein
VNELSRIHFADPLPAPVLVFLNESEKKAWFSQRFLDMFRGKDHITDKLFVALAWVMALALVFLVFEKIKWLSH